MRERFAKVRPPSTNISAWNRRLAPPDSTSRTIGSLFSSAICCVRNPFFTLIGVDVPPLKALSEAETMQRMPAT